MCIEITSDKVFSLRSLMKMDAGQVPPVAKRKKEVNEQMASSNPLL